MIRKTSLSPVDQRPPSLRQGFTVPEMVVYATIFILFLGGVITSFTWIRYSKSGMERLDTLHQLRLSSFAISEELSYGTSIIFPPIDRSRSEKPYHQLAFRNNANEILVAFVNERDQLVLANLTKKARNQTYLRRLTANVIEFRVRRPNSHYVEFEMTATDGNPTKPKQFHLGNSAQIRNIR